MANAQSQRPRLLRTLGDDAGRVWSEVRRAGPRRTVSRTFDDLQQFYFDDSRRERLRQMRPFRRAIHMTVALTKSLFIKLTPARRVLLVVALVLIWQTTGRVGEPAPGGSHFPVLGVGVLLFILLLELKDKLTARKELEAGRAVQQALMPDHQPAVPGWDVWLFTRSANDVGGDLVDAIPVSDGRFGVVLGDVAGKGLPAALLMAKLQATLRALVAGESSLVTLGEHTNQILCRDGLPNRFATLVYVDITKGSGAMRVLNAGHMPPVVLRGTSVETLKLGSMALGMLPNAVFSEEQVELSEGDMFIAFSDGLTEAMNEQGEFFGDERLHTCFESSEGLTAAALGARVLTRLEQFVGDARPHDDLSLIVLRRHDSAIS